jgi:hypothetical protein
MRLARLIPRSITQAELASFECRLCSVFLIEVAEGRSHDTRPVCLQLTGRT